MALIFSNHFGIKHAIKSFAQQTHGILVLTGLEQESKTELARTVEKEFKKNRKRGVFLSSSTFENESGGFENESSSWNFASFDGLDYLIADANISKFDDIERVLPTIARLIPEFSQNKLIVLTAQPQRIINDPPFYHEIFKNYRVSEIKIPEMDVPLTGGFKNSLMGAMKVIPVPFIKSKKDTDYRIIHNYMDE